MCWLRRGRFLVDYVGAVVYPGDHDIKPDLTDKRHGGLLELTESLRWVPEQGEGWSFPIAEIRILSPPTSVKEGVKGVSLSLPGVGAVRVRGTIPVGFPSLTMTREAVMSGPETERLRVELLRRGAVDAAAPERTGWDEVS